MSEADYRCDVYGALAADDGTMQDRGKSPRELLTGQTHPHWLTLLGLGELQPQHA